MVSALNLYTLFKKSLKWAFFQEFFRSDAKITIPILSIIFKAANVPVDFETFFFSEINPVLSSKLEDVKASIQKNKICLKVWASVVLDYSTFWNCSEMSFDRENNGFGSIFREF